jgi:hypothetical protein
MTACGGDGALYAATRDGRAKTNNAIGKFLPIRYNTAAIIDGSCGGPMDRDRITPEGYDKEEEYFYHKNVELIEKARKKLDADRLSTQQREQSKPHWMVCPKCGGTLGEVMMKGIKVDQCRGCGGIFMDKGEVDLLLKRSHPTAVTEGLKEVLKNFEPL